MGVTPGSTRAVEIEAPSGTIVRLGSEARRRRGTLNQRLADAIDLDRLVVSGNIRSAERDR